MSEPLLTICIPTFNRAGFLKRMCESIFANLDSELFNHLEVCISDNVSTDDTNIIANDFVARYPKNVRYKVNDKNYGAAFNALEVMKIAKGKYLWCIGDDDILIDGAIVYLLKMLMRLKDNSEIKVIFVKYNAKIKDEVIFKAFDMLQPGKIYRKHEVEDFFIKDKFWCNGFSAAQIFRKDAVQNYFNNLVNQDNCNLWPHLSILLYNFKTLKQTIVSEPVIYQTGDGLYWYRANWILALFQKVELLDAALLREEITAKMAIKICSSILLNFSMLRLAFAAKIEDPKQFLSVVKKISAYRVKNYNLRLRISIFKMLLNIVSLIPSRLLQSVYSFLVKLSGMNDIRLENKSPVFMSANKKEALTIN